MPAAAATLQAALVPHQATGLKRSLTRSIVWYHFDAGSPTCSCSLGQCPALQVRNLPGTSHTCTPKCCRRSAQSTQEVKAGVVGVEFSGLNTIGWCLSHTLDSRALGMSCTLTMHDSLSMMQSAAHTMLSWIQAGRGAAACTVHPVCSCNAVHAVVADSSTLHAVVHT